MGATTIHKRAIVIRVVSYLALVAAVIIALLASGLKLSDINPDRIRELAHDNLFEMMGIMLVVMVLQNLFTFIPLILVITANISLFGFVYGYLYGCLCSVIGSTLIFLSIRYVFKDLFRNKLVEKYQTKIEKNGFLFVLTSRIFPFVPTNLINITAGLSTVPIKHFIAATTIGNMIYSFVLASISYGVVSFMGQSAVNLLLTVIIIGGGIVIYVMRKRSKKQHN